MIGLATVPLLRLKTIFPFLPLNVFFFLNVINLGKSCSEKIRKEKKGEGGSEKTKIARPEKKHRKTSEGRRQKGKCLNKTDGCMPPPRLEKISDSGAARARQQPTPRHA